MNTGGSVPHVCPLCGGAGAVQGETRWQCEACEYTVPICLYWKSHGASPGEPVSYEDVLALEVFGQQRDVGVALVEQLRTLELTTDEAERLLARLQWLTRYVASPAAQMTG